MNRKWGEQSDWFDGVMKNKAEPTPSVTSINWWLYSPVLQEELQHYWADDGSFIHFIIKWGQKFCVDSRVICGEKKKIRLAGDRKWQETQLHEAEHQDEGSSPEPFRRLLWTNSRLRSSWITSASGGSLSLKHMVVTTSMKKLLHLCRNRAFLAMASLGEG